MAPAARARLAQQLFDIANKYFDAVSHKIDYHDVPWHPECQRIELGVFTVNSALARKLRRRVPDTVGEVERREPTLLHRRRRAWRRCSPSATSRRRPNIPSNNGSVVFEVFKVQDGLIRQIHAFFRGNGQLHSGWGDGPGS